MFQQCSAACEKIIISPFQLVRIEKLSIMRGLLLHVKNIPTNPNPNRIPVAGCG
jgi:hypothetical protein